MSNNKKKDTSTPSTPRAPRVFFNWTQENSTTACTMRKEGATNLAICTAIGCPVSSLTGLFNKLKKAGIEVPRAPGSRQALDLKQLGLVFKKTDEA
jgi:hypothetical protein